MIDLHNSSKYKLAYTSNSTHLRAVAPRLEVNGWNIPIRHCKMHPATSQLIFYQILIFLVLPKNSYFTLISMRYLCCRMSRDINVRWNIKLLLTRNLKNILFSHWVKSYEGEKCGQAPQLSRAAAPAMIHPSVDTGWFNWLIIRNKQVLSVSLTWGV